jgi:hypothetical protein
LPKPRETKRRRSAVRYVLLAVGIYLVGFFPALRWANPMIAVAMTSLMMILIAAGFHTVRQGIIGGLIYGTLAGMSIYGGMTTPLIHEISLREDALEQQQARAEKPPENGEQQPPQSADTASADSLHEEPADEETPATEQQPPDDQPQIKPMTQADRQEYDRTLKILLYKTIPPPIVICTAIGALFAHRAAKRRKKIAASWKEETAVKKPFTVIPEKPPPVLKPIAALLIVSGAIGLVTTTFKIIGVLIYIQHLVLSIDLLALNLFAGLGLLIASRGWRIFVLAELWVVFILGIIGIVYLAANTGPVHFVLFFGTGKLTTSRLQAMVFVIAVLIVAAWMYVTLCLPKIREFFFAPPAIINSSIIRTVETFEDYQRNNEYDSFSARMHKLENAITELEALRHSLTDPQRDAVFNEAAQKAEDLLQRAKQVREEYVRGGPEVD